MRLDKFIADSGAFTRGMVKRIIRSGAVTVNGVTAEKPDMKIDEGNDEVTVNGCRIEYKPFVYLMMNKPDGYVSAVRDERYPAVTGLVGESYEHYRVFPVGRLDVDTEGLLLLTNDGDFCHRLTSPRKNIYKRYFAVLDNAAEESDIEAFAAGMELGDFTAKPARLEITERKNEVYIEIAEGRFHQIKRMCKKVGKNVTYLKRVAVGSLVLDDRLAPGQLRELTAEELDALAYASVLQNERSD